MATSASEISTFFLYGEPARPAGERFVHLELLDNRSRPANWIIRPHAHVDLHHIFLVETGGGAALADGVEFSFSAPCIVIVPAAVVHGFRWIAETQGRVLTFSGSFLRTLAGRELRLAALFDAGLWSSPADIATTASMMTLLERELGWEAPGHELAVEVYLSAILLEAMRLRQRLDREAKAPPGPQALLVARFRELVEVSYREHMSVESYAARLGVTPGRLRAACRRVAGVSPASMLGDRLRLEAQRLMRYSNMTIGQVALYLGFDDPAYFSRFFARTAGASPRAFKNASGVAI